MKKILVIMILALSLLSCKSMTVVNNDTSVKACMDYVGNQVIPIGISGSGKNHYQSQNLPKVVVLEPDQIRKKWLGDVNCQTRNASVFDILRHQMREVMSYGAEDIYLSEMHIWLPGIQEEVDEVLSYGYEPVFILLESSRDWELCTKRVREALASGDGRAATANVITANGKPLIQEMSERYINLVDSDEFKALVRGYQVISV